MNIDLIKNFSSRASDYASSKVGVQNDVNYKEYLEYYTLKFSELLISECAELCTNFRFSDEGPGDGASYQRALCNIVIKEHFGLISKGPLSSKVIR